MQPIPVMTNQDGVMTNQDGGDGNKQMRDSVSLGVGEAFALRLASILPFSSSMEKTVLF